MSQYKHKKIPESYFIALIRSWHTHTRIYTHKSALSHWSKNNPTSFCPYILCGIEVFRDLNTSKASSEKPLFFKLSITVKALIFMDYCGGCWCRQTCIIVSILCLRQWGNFSVQVNGYEGDRAGHLKEMFCFCSELGTFLEFWFQWDGMN